jgi:hypothetical protein
MLGHVISLGLHVTQLRIPLFEPKELHQEMLIFVWAEL